MSLHLILGGARSGKSAHAQRLAEGLAARDSRPLVFVATAEPGDAEMAERIARHRADRDARWLTVEAPLDLAAALDEAGEAVALVDCLTLWLTNSMLAEDGAGGHDGRLAGLAVALRCRAAPTVVVSNEVGWGLVPETPLGRRFRDEAGRLNQAFAAAADEVVLVVAGLSLTLKSP